MFQTKKRKEFLEWVSRNTSVLEMKHFFHKRRTLRTLKKYYNQLKKDGMLHESSLIIGNHFRLKK